MGEAVLVAADRMGAVVRADRRDGIWVRVQDHRDGPCPGLGVLCGDAVPVRGQRPAGIYLSLSVAALAGAGRTGGNPGRGVKSVLVKRAAIP